MIIYQADKRRFLRDTFQDEAQDIQDIMAQQYLRTTGRSVQPTELNAWKHSLVEVGEVLQDPGIPDDMGVALEYTVPQTAKRIDVLLTGTDAANSPAVLDHAHRRPSRSGLAVIHALTSRKFASTRHCMPSHFRSHT